MTQDFDVDGNRFSFPDDWHVFVYDTWSFYRKKLAGPPLAATACDLVAVGDDTLYLIEAKDYTFPPGTRAPSIQELAATVSRKGFHTIAGLMAGAHAVGEQQDACRRAVACSRLVLSLSVELPGRANSMMWGRPTLDSLRDAIRRQAGYLQTKPIVVSNRLSGSVPVPWQSAPLRQP